MSSGNQASFETLSARFSDFDERQKIGSGKDCVIYRARWASLPQPRTVVVKAYDRGTVSKMKIRSIKREARMMHTVNLARVPHVVGFHGSFQDSKCYYLVMEYCAKGDLLEKILGEGRAMEERRVVNEVAVPLLISLTALHKLDLIHRDIKLENVFVDGRDCVKFGDFGLTMSTKEERGISPVGTVEYMAPELCLLPPAEMIMSGRIDPVEIEPVDEKVDIWALGVTLYELLTGRSPFEGEEKAKLKQNIIKYRIRRLPRHLSSECEDFLRQMLRYRAQDRPSARTLLEHPWIERHAATGYRGGIAARTGSQGDGAERVMTIRHQSESATPLPQAATGLQQRFSENASTAPRLSPTSLSLVTERRREKFQDKLARLLPTYRSPHERAICMRGLWTLDLSESDSEDEMA